MTRLGRDAIPPVQGAETGDRCRPCAATGRLTIPACAADDTFHILLAYVPFGGTLNGNELALLLRHRTDQPLSMLARWLVGRSLISFPWRGQTCIPIFQLDVTAMTVRLDVQRVLTELAPVLDDVTVARWFVQVNPRLAGFAPLHVLEQEPEAVLQAARRVRYASGS